MVRHRILLEDGVAIWIHPLDPEDHMLSEKALINVSIDLFADANWNNRTLLTVTVHHPEDHLLQRSFGEGRDAKMMRLAGLQIVQ